MAAPDAGERSKVNAAAADLPIAFEPNLGQSDEQVAFLAHGPGYGLFLTPDELALSLRRTAPQADNDAGGSPERARHVAALAPSVLRMRLEGASHSTPVGEEPLETRTNYLIGDDPALWHTDVPTFGRVRYPQVYPGVDLVYYSDHGQLEYDFEVAPGTDPGRIVLDWEGAESIDLDDVGTLVMKVASGEVRQAVPVVYQETEAGRTAVAGQFAPAAGGRVGVSLGAYDASRPLVIDPVLTYSTYLGGALGDVANGIAIGPSGEAYVTGQTGSSNFPTEAANDSTFGGGLDILTDAFVTKLNVKGTALVYSTYLGGRGDDVGNAIAVDANGAAYIAGWTSSGNFPTLHAFDTSFNGGHDAFLTKLGPTGGLSSDQDLSTYFGGSLDEEANSIAVDADGAAYITGVVTSTDLPLNSAIDTSQNGGQDAFVAKLQLTVYLIGDVRLILTRDVYSTYLGGSGDDVGNAIAVDDDGAAYVTGSTVSNNFPTHAAFDATYNGNPGAPRTDAFVTKLGVTGATLTYSTYLGAGGDDVGNAIVVDSTHAAYVTGLTGSNNFPLVAAFDSSLGGEDAFVTKLSPAGNTLVFSTFLGGGDTDEGRGIALDSDRNVYVTGSTQSSNFPIFAAFDETFNGGFQDVFVTKFDASGGSLVYSTFIGGADRDEGRAIAVNASTRAAFVAGNTLSRNFPTSHPFDQTFNDLGPSGGDAFVLQLR
jgi:hypothetical protein